MTTAPLMPKRSRRAAGRNGRTAPEPLRYATAYHAPVLSREVVDLLVADPSGTYVDGTLGGGGHSAALLEVLDAHGTVVGIDRDAEAISAATARLGEDDRFIPVHGLFSQMGDLLRGAGVSNVTGILLDLGVSSHQIDEAQRGFSFSQEGSLDMRMDPGRGESASSLIERLSVSDLADVLYEYGEERRSRRIARSIKEARPQTTDALAEAIRKAVPGQDERKSLARVFQALRIAVNSELDELETALQTALEALAPGGRLAVISYHSLEDRRAKRFLRFGHFGSIPRKDFFGNDLTPWKPISRKPIEAGPEEVAANPRARSARLRVSEKAIPDNP